MLEHMHMQDTTSNSAPQTPTAQTPRVIVDDAGVLPLDEHLIRLHADRADLLSLHAGDVIYAVADATRDEAAGQRNSFGTTYRSFTPWAEMCLRHGFGEDWAGKAGLVRLGLVCDLQAALRCFLATAGVQA